MQDERLNALTTENEQLRADIKVEVQKTIDLTERIKDLEKVNAEQVQRLVDNDLLRTRIAELESKSSERDLRKALIEAQDKLKKLQPKEKTS